jgi:hypothetical protein
MIKLLISKTHQYITKTNPQERSDLYFQNLAKYLELGRELQSVEEAIFQLRLATTDMERAILVEDVQLRQPTPTKKAPTSEYFGNRLSYMELVEDLRATEMSIVEARVTMLQLELAVLQEELPHARRRKQVAESHTHLEFDRQARFCQSHYASSGTASVPTTSIVDSDSDTETVCTAETTLSATLTLVSTSPKRKVPDRAPIRTRAAVRRN